MAKLIVFAAILVALLALAQASRFTITTTVEEDEDNIGQSQQRCQRQIRQQYQQLRGCQRYLSSQRPGSPLEMDIMIQQDGQQGTPQQQQQLRQCCQGLQNLDNRCRCEAVREAVRQVQQQGPGQQGQGMHQVRQTARILPQRCNLEPQECPV